MNNKVGLQEGTYQEIRARFGLPAQMALLSASPGWGHLQNALDARQGQCEARQAGLTRKSYK
jgi:hypothetical protein